MALGGGVDDLIDARKGERILGASFVKVGEVDAHLFLPAFLWHHDGVPQPLRVPDLANDTCRLQLASFLDDEGLLLRGLSPRLLLHRAHIGAHPQVMLDHPPRDPY